MENKNSIKVILVKILFFLVIILIFIQIPKIISFFSVGDLTLEDQKIILSAAKEYVLESEDKIINYDDYCISLNELKEKNFLDSESLSDSKLFDIYMVSYSKIKQDYEIVKHNVCRSKLSNEKNVKSIVLDSVSSKIVKDDNIYLAGSQTECNTNYLWYSGKLWRVMGYNRQNKTVKLVMDNSATILQYGHNANYENSFIDQWLTQEFLPTLNNYEEYLVLSDFNASMSNDPNNLGNDHLVKRYVGLLNTEEYNNICDTKSCYLLEGTINKSFWFMNASDTNKVYSIYTSTEALMPTLQGMGIRPVIYLKDDILIKSGIGTIDDPYRIEDGEDSNLLNKRNSGEYVNFDGSLYRIVSIEGDMTKVTAVSIPDLLLDKQFDTAKRNNYRYATINNYLNNTFYSSISDSYREMIVPNTTWYIGASSSNLFNYKLHVCASLDDNVSISTCPKTSNVALATIGMPRYGELFTSQIDRNVQKTYWTLSPYYNTSLRGINDQGWLFTNIDVFSYLILNIRPSFYLNKDVKVTCDREFCGTYEYPYNLTI